MERSVPSTLAADNAMEKVTVAVPSASAETEPVLTQSAVVPAVSLNDAPALAITHIS